MIRIFTVALCFVLMPAALPANEVADAVAALERIGGIALKTNEGWDLEFHVRGRKLTDNDLRHVATIGDVISLNLRDTQVTNAGLKHLSKLSTLRTLHLERTVVGDEGVKHLIKLPKLVYLNLYGTDVSDAAVDSLVQIKSLQRLYVWQSKVTKSGVDRLKKMRPALHVVFGVNLSKLPKEFVPKPPPMPKISLKWMSIANRNEAAARSKTGTNMRLHFENKRDELIKIYWIGYDGSLKLYGELEPNKKREQNTYSNNAWLITDGNDKALGWFLVEKPEDAFAVIPAN